MSYVQKLQLEQQPGRGSWGSGVQQQPVESYGYQQVTFFGVYNAGGSNRSCRVVLQAETAELGLDPSKTYRVTVEEVTA